MRIYVSAKYEILAKKGDGLQRIIDACGGAQEAFQIMLLEHLDNLAEASSKAISNIKFDKVVVWENGGQDGKGSTSKFLSSMAHTLPPMLQVMQDIGGVTIPESLVKLAGEQSTDGADIAPLMAAVEETPQPSVADTTPEDTSAGDDNPGTDG